MFFSPFLLVFTGKPNPAADGDDKDADDDQYLWDEGNYDYTEEDYASEDGDGGGHRDAEIQDLPEFVTKGSSFTVDKGTTIRLPCYVDKLPCKSERIKRELDQLLDLSALSIIRRLTLYFTVLE